MALLQHLQLQPQPPLRRWERQHRQAAPTRTSCHPRTLRLKRKHQVLRLPLPAQGVDLLAELLLMQASGVSALGTASLSLRGLAVRWRGLRVVIRVQSLPLK